MKKPFAFSLRHNSLARVDRLISTRLSSRCDTIFRVAFACIEKFSVAGSDLLKSFSEIFSPSDGISGNVLR
jgi:hypothetical protein